MPTTPVVMRESPVSLGTMFLKKSITRKEVGEAQVESGWAVEIGIMERSSNSSGDVSWPDAPSLKIRLPCSIPCHGLSGHVILLSYAWPGKSIDILSFTTDMCLQKFRVIIRPN